MSFSVGIVGLPNAGKSTLFKALTKNSVEIADYPFTTIDPNVGLVPVPDKRLKEIKEVVQPEIIKPAFIEIIDIAGLVKGAHKGEGLGNRFLAQIRECDAIINVVKAFGESDPTGDIETIRTELELKDLESKEKEDLLAKKPTVYLLNVDEESSFKEPEVDYLAVNLKNEAEMSDLSDKEKQELGLKSRLDRLILNCYNVLNLVTFFTVAGAKEIRAWALKKESVITRAAGMVHSDFEKMIKAQVIPWQELVKAGSWTKAKELGLVKTAGKDYLVQEGDVIEFKI